MAEQEPPAAQAERTSEGPASRVPIWDLVRYYLRLGALGLGGPAALCGQMERELVGERKWLTRDEMREAIAVCQSMPGPLAIQVWIFISYLRGGFWDSLVATVGIFLPSFLFVLIVVPILIRIVPIATSRGLSTVPTPRPSAQFWGPAFC